MAHDVNQSEVDVATGLQQAVRESIGSDRFELWLDSGTRWSWKDDKLVICFPNDFSAQVAQRMVHADVAAAIEAHLGFPVTVLFMASEDRAAVAPPREERAHATSSERQTSTGVASGTVANTNSDEAAACFAADQPVDSASQPNGQFGGSQGRRQGETDKPGKNGNLEATGDPGKPVKPGAFRAPGALDRADLSQNPTELDCRSGGGEGINRPECGGQSAAANNLSPRRSTASEPSMVVSENNKLAWTTAKLVVAEPGKYSPATFYGPHGCGKSMLAKTVASLLRRRREIRRVALVTSEQFTNDFTTALCGKQLPLFRDKYRGVDALVLEDVQFLKGKRATISEFRYTIDNLLRRGKQVVLTSDRPIAELEELGQQVISRIQAGLAAPMFPLDKQARVQIIRRDLEEAGVEITEEALEQLAEHASGDGRVLSGITKRLVALYRMSGEPLNWQACWSAVSDLVHAVHPVVQIKDIERAVCNVFGLAPQSLQSKQRTRRVCQPRMVAMFLARKYTPAAYKEIGQYFGKRRHSTVIAAQRVVEEWLRDNVPLEAAGGLPIREAIRHAESQLKVG